MGEVTVREATAADVAELLALYQAAGIGVGESFNVDEAVAQLERMRRYPFLKVWVAVCGQRAVGTYELLVMDNLAKHGRRSAVVEDVAVDPAWQGRGIGRLMMAHAIEQSRRQGCYKLTLSSNVQRERAHAFYESLGFVRHGYSFVVELRASPG